MQFRDLEAQYKLLKSEIDVGIQQVIDAHAFINGPQVRQLESELTKYVGRKHCVACASGTDALILPIMAWGIGPGDAVFVPDFTYFASVNSSMLRGATPVLVDIDEDTFNISPEALERAIERVEVESVLRPRLVVPVDLFGQPAPHAAVARIAAEHGLLVLDDAAQGFGGSIDGRMVGSFGDVAATSFFPAKPLGCYGDGGAMFTDDDEMAAKLSSLAKQGSSPVDKYDNVSIGLNSRLDTLQAAILLPKLHAFMEHEVDDVNRVAARYTELLASCDAVVTPKVPDGYTSSWAQYTVLLPDVAQRDAAKRALGEAGIPAMVYYPRGMHQQTALIEAGCSTGNYSVTESVVQRCLSLPMGPYLTEDDQDAVVRVVQKACG